MKAGWHVDPQNAGGERLWDGNQWTGTTRVPSAIDTKQFQQLVDQLNQIRISVSILAALTRVGAIVAATGAV